MSGPAQGSSRVWFGEFELNLDTAELRHNGSGQFFPDSLSKYWSRC